MDKKEALRLSGFKKFPKVFKDGIPKGKCIAKVSRQWGDDDYAIYQDGRVVCDKGYIYMIDKVKQYYYEEPVLVVDKVAEIQKLADEAKKQKDIEAVWDEAHEELAQFDADNKDGVERPTVYADMIAFIADNNLTEEKTFGMSKVRAEEILDKHFA